MDTTCVVVLDLAGKFKRGCVLPLFKHESELGVEQRWLDNLKSKPGAFHYANYS